MQTIRRPSRGIAPNVVAHALRAKRDVRRRTSDAWPTASRDGTFPSCWTMQTPSNPSSWHVGRPRRLRCGPSVCKWVWGRRWTCWTRPGGRRIDRPTPTTSSPSSQWQHLHPDVATFETWLRGVLERRPAEGPAVLLSTIHKIKGREWEHVVVYGASAGTAPSPSERRRGGRTARLPRGTHASHPPGTRSWPTPMSRLPLWPSSMAAGRITRCRSTPGRTVVPSRAVWPSGRPRGRSRSSEAEPAGSRQGNGVHATGLERSGGRRGCRPHDRLRGPHGCRGRAHRLGGSDPRRQRATQGALRVRRAGGRTHRHARCPERGARIRPQAYEGALREWRSEAAKRATVPAYVVLNDNELVGIASRRPTTLAELARCKGMGPVVWSAGVTSSWPC